MACKPAVGYIAGLAIDYMTTSGWRVQAVCVIGGLKRQNTLISTAEAMALAKTKKRFIHFCQVHISKSCFS